MPTSQHCLYSADLPAVQMNEREWGKKGEEKNTFKSVKFFLFWQRLGEGI